MINCHLAAGQNNVRARNADIASFLEEKALFPTTVFPLAYVGGGDGKRLEGSDIHADMAPMPMDEDDGDDSFEDGEAEHRSERPSRKRARLA